MTRAAWVAARVADHETRICSLEGLTYHHERRLIRLDIGMDRLLSHFGIPRATGAEIDAELER